MLESLSSDFNSAIKKNADPLFEKSLPNVVASVGRILMLLFDEWITDQVRFRVLLLRFTIGIMRNPLEMV